MQFLCSHGKEAIRSTRNFFSARFYVLRNVAVHFSTSSAGHRHRDVYLGLGDDYDYANQFLSCYC
jgi:hypothetical protein